MASWSCSCSICLLKLGNIKVGTAAWNAHEGAPATAFDSVSLRFTRGKARKKIVHGSRLERRPACSGPAEMHCKALRLRPTKHMHMQNTLHRPQRDTHSYGTWRHQKCKNRHKPAHRSHTFSFFSSHLSFPSHETRGPAPQAGPRVGEQQRKRNTHGGTCAGVSASAERCNY